MSKRKFYEDYNFTCRLGIIFILIFLLLNILGQSKRTEPRPLISPIASVKEVEAQEPTPTPILSQKEQINKEIKDVFGEQAELAKHVAFCESSLNPEATHKNNDGTIDVGLFQINSIHNQKTEDMLNYKKNIEYAYKLFLNQGLQPWISSEDCYK